MMEAERNMMISIIIPVYNVEKYLKTCIDSVIESDIFKFRSSVN